MPPKRKIQQLNNPDHLNNMTELVNAYSNLSERDLFDNVSIVLQELEIYKNRNYNSVKLAETQEKLQAIRIAAQSIVKTAKEFQGIYPEVEDKEFLEKLMQKKEFAKNLHHVVKLSLKEFDQYAHEKCNPAGMFNLSLNQMFVKNYLSPNTPYRSMILFHGVGVGKTATAVSIAENFRTKFSSKTIVIMPKSLKDNFRKQLFNVAKLKEDITGRNQIVAWKYLEQIRNYKTIGLEHEVLDKKINKMISEHYEFWGFLEFANSLIDIKEAIKKLDNRANIVESKFNNRLREMFSNRVIIIDEVHNIREEDSTQKIAPPLVKQMLENAENSRLVMLSATPMFNRAEEIVQLLNLVLANEKRPQLSENQIFSKTGDITPQGHDILANACKGYVSYMRGENPFTFPIRLYPSINQDKLVMKKENMPNFKITPLNSEIPEEERLQNSQYEFIKSVMSKLQTDVYRQYENQYARKKDDVDDDDESVEEGHDNDKTVIGDSKPMQSSIIVFPSAKKGTYGFGKSGFNDAFDKVPGKQFKYMYKQRTLLEHGPILDIDHISTYSAKIKSIIEYIKKSKGIVFIYSFFIYGSLIPLAIALEHIGFQRAGGDNILEQPTGKNVPPPFLINGKRASYSILARDQDLCPNMQREIDMITSSDNIIGDKVKVILGSSVTAEGIDFKRIREVHLMEPWYHFNKMEQVIGRAVRTCSHISLPKEERNVTVYHHVAVPYDYDNTKHKQESIDLWRYRLAFSKQKPINQVELILQENAVDCYLNQNVSFYDPKKLNLTMDITTSQGTTLTKFKLGDGDYSRYRHGAIKCKGYKELNGLGTDTTTFGKDFYADDVVIYTQYVARLFSGYAQKLSLEEIERLLTNQIQNFDDTILHFAIQQMVSEKMTLSNHKHLIGRLVYIGNLYSFVPVNTPFSYVTKTEQLYFKPSMSRLKLDTGVNVDENNKNEQDDQKLGSTKQNIDKKSWDDVIEEKVHGLYDLFKVKSEDNKNIRNIALEKMKQYFYDYVIDRLDHNSLISLCVQTCREGPLKKPSKTNSNAISRDVFTIIKSSLISGQYMVLDNKDVKQKVFLQTPYTGTIFVLVDDVLRPIQPLEENRFRSLVIDSKMKYAEKTLLDFKGFLATSVPYEEPLFRMVGEKAKSTGTVCEKTSKITVATLKKALLDLDINVLPVGNAYTKIPLCKLYEILLRATIESFLRPLQYIYLTSKNEN